MTYKTLESLRSFVPVGPQSHFPIQNLPYGVMRRRGADDPVIGVAIGEFVLDLSVLENNSLLDVTGGGTADLQRSSAAAASSAYTAHLMDPRRDTAFFVAFSPASRLAFGYVWHRADFPWLGIWEENASRPAAPWNGATLARGMEFGASPFPETRREMIERGRLFDVPTFRWIPAASRVTVNYAIVAQPADAVPETLE